MVIRPSKGRTGSASIRSGNTERHGASGPNIRKRLQLLAARLSGVLIENRPPIDVMPQYDTPTTLHCVDPPYLHSTRVLQSKGHACDRHEMNDAEHSELLGAL